MSKVKIQGHASGTGVLTVTAPNTSTDRTITLPDSTATLFTDAGGTLTGNTTIATNSVPTLALKRTGNNAGNGYIECHGADDSVDYAIRFAQTNGVMSFDNGGSRIMGVTADGLTFGSDTAAANALDDYEEGTWTPTFANVTVTSYDQQHGYYTKIGNRVFGGGVISSNNYDNSDSSSINILGLPFTVADNTEEYGVFSLYPEKGVVTSSGNTPILFGFKDQTYMLPYNWTSGTGDNTNGIQYSACGSHLRLRFTFQYQI